MIIQPIESIEDIKRCYKAFLALRPHLTNLEDFVSQVVMQQKEGYHLMAVYHQEQVAACIGFRLMTTLAWGKIMHIDDFITQKEYRGKGYGHALLTYVIDLAKKQNCHQVHLDTGYTRHAAHRVYLHHGFQLNCHHMALIV